MINELHSDAMRKTAKHIRRVQSLLCEITNELTQRAIHHDKTKWSDEEWPYFAENTEKLKGVTYGSDEYKAQLELLKPAIQHHQTNNSHHPEFYNNDVTKMSLLDLVEMLADWKAATERHEDGNIERSLEINKVRFNIPEPIVRILENTIREMKWQY